MFENKYCDNTTSLQNLALQLTNLSYAEIIKIRQENGDSGLLKAISENLKPLVTVDEMNAAIEKAVADAVSAAE